MAKRSPILGYNHNMQHRGLVFHVQTEDSGVDNPHIFTHLFHGGVIINTRKLVYDAEASESVVKSLMQAQHKAMLKDLKKGKFTEKIDAYLGDNPDLQPFDARNDTVQRPETEPFQKFDEAEIDQVGRAPTVDISQAPPEVAQAMSSVSKPAPTPPAPLPDPQPAVGRSPTQPSIAARAVADRPHDASGTYSQHRRGPTKPPAQGKRSAGKSSGVVVSRPAVIVGAPPRVVGNGGKPAAAQGKQPARKVSEKPPESLFGQGLISEKSLDEVILAYLSDDSSEE